MHVWVDFGNRNDQNIVTENGVRLLTTQKPLKRPGWWKRKFALLCMPATNEGEGKQTPVQRLSSLPLSVSVEELLLTEEEATYRNSTVNSVILKLVTSHLDCFR